MRVMTSRMHGIRSKRVLINITEQIDVAAVKNKKIGRKKRRE